MADGDEPPSEGNAMGAEAIPDWMRIPQGQWTADDLDLVPEEAGRCEVLDGALIVMSPQRFSIRPRFGASPTRSKSRRRRGGRS